MKDTGIGEHQARTSIYGGVGAESVVIGAPPRIFVADAPTEALAIIGAGHLLACGRGRGHYPHSPRYVCPDGL